MASAPSNVSPHPSAHKRPQHEQTVLLLQGGGALGSYQAGAYEGLSTNHHEPDWVVGVSIGAINASLIAGNPPERRIERLREFWHRVTAPANMLQQSFCWGSEQFAQKIGATGALLFGQPGFFAPWAWADWFIGSPTSYYDTSLLRATLLEMVDFDLINQRKTRLSLGAVHVTTGNMIYFDNHKIKIEPEHIMASGALPPGFPAVEINHQDFWDGGLVSNTPLSYFMEHQPRQTSLVFQVDLFPSRGKMPTTMDEVLEREKDIRYSSRTRLVVDAEREHQNLRRAVAHFLKHLPEGAKDDPMLERLRTFACPARIDVALLIYRPTEPQGSQKDYQFDRATSERRWADGQSDAQTSIEAAPWRAPYHEAAGMRCFDVAMGRHK